MKCYGMLVSSLITTVFIFSAGNVYADSYPSDARVLNVKTMYGAYGDGLHDDTVAINNAIHDSMPAGGLGVWMGQAKIVYLPAGTYKITDRLLRQDNGGWTYGLILVGESQANTSIRLGDDSAGFGDPANPKAMIFTTSAVLNNQATPPGHSTLGTGNDAYQNSVQDLTIDIGSGNPGAIGIDYLASNLGAIRNVTVRAASGETGVTGIAMTRPWAGPALLSNVTVSGSFAVGIDVANLQYTMTLNQIRLNGMTLAGLRNTQNQLAITTMSVTAAAPAIVNSSADAEIVLSGADLHLAAGYSGATISNSGTIVFRNSNKVDGYRSFVGYSLPGDVVAGIWSGGQFINKQGGEFNTYTALNDPPVTPLDPISSWANVLSYGAVTSGEFTTSAGGPTQTVVDDTTAIQNAMNSGASTIYFPHALYYISRPILIPSTVRRIIGFNSRIRPVFASNNAGWRTNGMFRALENTADPLTIEKIAFDNSGFGDQVGLELGSPRTLVVRDVLFAGSTPLTRTGSGGTVYFEDISAVGGDGTSKVGIIVSGTNPFIARQLDYERCLTCIQITDAPAVIVGMKEEGNVTFVSSLGNAKVDVLGGLAYIVTSAADPSHGLFYAEGQLRASFTEATLKYGAGCGVSSGCYYPYYLFEHWGGTDYKFSSLNYPARSDGGHVVPLVQTGPTVISPNLLTTSSGNAITISGVSVIDPYALGNPGQCTLIVKAQSGVLTMASGGSNLPDSGTARITYTATLAEINAALDSLSYQPSNTVGEDTVAITLYDQKGISSTAFTHLTIH